MELEQRNPEVDLVSDEGTTILRQPRLELKEGPQQSAEHQLVDQKAVSTGAHGDLQPLELKTISTGPGTDLQPWKRRSLAGKNETPATSLPDDSNYYYTIPRRLGAHLIDCTVVGLFGALILALAMIPDAYCWTNVAEWRSMILAGFLLYGGGALGSVITAVLPFYIMDELFIGTVRQTLVPSVIALMYGPIFIDAIYRSVMESSSKQATIGKMMMKIKVTGSRGERLTLLRALMRHLAKPLGILSLPGLPLSGKRLWHDKIIGTTVVANANDAPPAMADENLSVDQKDA